MLSPKWLVWSVKQGNIVPNKLHYEKKNYGKKWQNWSACRANETLYLMVIWTSERSSWRSRPHFCTDNKPCNVKIRNYQWNTSSAVNKMCLKCGCQETQGQGHKGVKCDVIWSRLAPGMYIKYEYCIFSGSKVTGKVKVYKQMYRVIPKITLPWSAYLGDYKNCSKGFVHRL